MASKPSILYSTDGIVFLKAKSHRETLKSDWLLTADDCKKLSCGHLFLAIHTLAELPWSLSSGYNKIPSASLIKCDMLLKVQVSHEMDHEGKGMGIGGEQDPRTFFISTIKAEGKPLKSGSGLW